MIRDGQLTIKNPRDTQVALLPVLVPMLDIDAIGAGGGSIAYLDAGGAFRVGPRSAGAAPGPACYGRGGTEPTVTDAQVVLGRLDPDRFLGGDLQIDPELARRAIETHLAVPLGLSVADAALGVLRIVNHTMALAINANSVAKGIDPRGFTLMAFGGAGPLHGVALGELISARDVISPLHPGITAAIGLLVTELQYEYTRSVLIVLSTAGAAELARLEAAFTELAAEGAAQLDSDGIPMDQRSYQRVMECRYVGQGFELRARVPDGPIDAECLQAVIRDLYDVHKQVYGHAFDDQAVEAVTLRLIARGATDIAQPARPRPRRPQQSGGRIDVHARHGVRRRPGAAHPALWPRPAAGGGHRRRSGHHHTAQQHDHRPARLRRPRALARRHRDREGDPHMTETPASTSLVDPITLQVIGGALHAIAEQMGTVLYRMSYSSIIRESQDLGAGLFDRDFNTLAESELDADAHRLAAGLPARH